MKKIILILLTVYCLLITGYAQENNHIFVERGSTTTLTWKAAGDYSAYDSLYFVVKPCTSNTCNRLIQKPTTVSYSAPYTTLTCTLYVDETASFNAAKYYYSIYAYGPDTVWVTSGNFNLMLNGQTPTDGVPTATPYYTVALDTPNATNTFIVGQDSDNVWYRKTVDQTRTILNITDDTTTVNANFDSLYTKTSYIVIPEMFGAVGNGSTDDSTAFDLAFAYLYSIGGGELRLSDKHYIDGSQWLIPHNSDTSSGYYTNVPIIISGSGNFTKTAGTTTEPLGGTIVEFTYDGGDSVFILTMGLGTLAIENLTFYTQVANKSFFKTTATTSYIRNTTFFGSGASSNASNDAIVCGGTHTTAFANGNSPFQGYGSIFSENYFYRIRRGLYLRRYANGIQIVNNTWWLTCGSNIDSVGAIEIVGGSSNADVGNYIAGNLVEMVGYDYFVKGTYANNNSFIGNNLYDDADVYAYYRFETNSTYNLIQYGYQGIATAISEDVSSLNKNTAITGDANSPTKFTGVTSFYNGNYYYNNYPLRFYNTDTYRYWQYGILGSSSPYYFNTTFNDSGTAYMPLSIQYYPNTLTNLILGNEGYVSASSGNLRLKASGSNSVWLGQDNLLYVNAGRLFSVLTTGTAPFSITSTTPVENLTVKRIYTPSFIGAVATNIDMDNYDITRLGLLNYSGVQFNSIGLNANDIYANPNSGILSVAIGENLLLNGNFTDWTGDNPDNWNVSLEDAGNYVEESPTGTLHFVTDGNTHAWSISQTGVMDSNVAYGYYFRIDSCSANDTIIIGSGGYNINVTTAGTYSGTFTSSGSAYDQVGIRNEDNDVSYYIDDFRIWQKTGGALQAPVYIHAPQRPDQILNPTTADTISNFYTHSAITIDSIQVRTDDSITVVGTFGALGLGTTCFNAYTNVSGWNTITTFNDATIPAGNEFYFYFTYLGDALTYFRYKIYWRE